MGPDAQASMFSKLWIDTCARHFSDPVALRLAAKTYRFQENPTYAKDLLAGQAGTVWDVSLGEMLQQALVLLDNGTCKVLARKASASTVIASFEAVVQGINTPGVSVERFLDRDVERSSVKLRQIGYFLTRTGADEGWSFVATVSEADTATHQATISIFRSRRPQK